MISDLHVHTNFCDGNNSPEETVLSAIEKGFDRLGLVVHAPMMFECSWAVKKERVKEFQAEMQRLKEKYKDKIELLCGIELDVFCDVDLSGFDYTIGSVHYFYKDGQHSPIDHSEEDFKNSVKTLFNGDYYSAVENYYELVSTYATKFNPDIIGHFDLVRKFNKGERLFSETHPRYIKARNDAMDKLLTLNVPFEINTGAIARGYQDNPYPSKESIKRIKEKGGSLIINSDSHSAQNVGFEYDKWSELAE